METVSTLPLFHPSLRPYRFTVLAFASLLAFGSYFAYDSVGAIETTLIQAFHADRAAIGAMYSAYSIAAVFAVFFAGLPNPFTATRYHSLVVSADSCPDDLEPTATTQDGVIMAIRHKKFVIEGVQFHPESVLTPMGERLLDNWLNS